MATKLMLKSQGNRNSKSRKRPLARHAHLEDCCRRQKKTRMPRRETRAKTSSTKLADKNVIEVIKSISGSSGSSSRNCFLANNDELNVLRTESESSVIYVGTYMKSAVPWKESVIDLTKSDTNISTSHNFHLDTYDISGDNIIDELFLIDHVSSAASIFTIFPPQPENLFLSPSDELCAFHKEHSCCTVSNKRNLSTLDVASDIGSRKAKRVLSNSAMVSHVNSNSLDCVWKLKKSYPLTNDLCENNDEDSIHDTDIDQNDVDIYDIVENLKKELNLTKYQCSALTEELRALKSASVLE